LRNRLKSARLQKIGALASPAAPQILVGPRPVSSPTPSPHDAHEIAAEHDDDDNPRTDDRSMGEPASQPASHSQRATDGGRAGRRDPFSLRRCRCLYRASASRWVSSDHDELPGLGWVWVGPVHWAFLFRRPAAPARRLVFSLLCLLSGLVVLVSAICCQIIAILQKIESLIDEIHTKQKPLKLDENCQILDECAHVWMEFFVVIHVSTSLPRLSPM